MNVFLDPYTAIFHHYVMNCIHFRRSKQKLLKCDLFSLINLWVFHVQLFSHSLVRKELAVDLYHSNLDIITDKLPDSEEDIPGGS